jgi:hypothetical protein
VDYEEWLEMTGQMIPVSSGENNDTSMLPHAVEKRYKKTPRENPVTFKPSPWPAEGDIVFPIPPWPRSCDQDAQRAKWKWRDMCDRSAPAHFNKLCWNRAPSTERCCTEDGRALYTSNCVNSEWWPKTAQEAAICTYKCDLETTLLCKWGDDERINNPKHLCECQYRRCSVPHVNECPNTEHRKAKRSDLVEARSRLDEEWRHLQRQWELLDEEWRRLQNGTCTRSYERRRRPEA